MTSPAPKPARNRRLRRSLLAGGALAAAALFAGVTAQASGPVKVGFIVKTLTNPYFAAMQKAAVAEAKTAGVHMVFEAGKYDGDVGTQISDIEDLTTRGVNAIIIAPSVSASVVPALRKAQKAGVTVIAVDTAIGPPDIANSFVATDNFKGGLKDGEWAKAAMHGKKPVVALLEGTPASSVNTERMGGFLKGMGMTKSQAAVDLITNGDQTKALTAMQNALVAHPDINLVWTINEPAAFGAYTAIEKAGLAGKIKIVTMDGSCSGMKAVADGHFSADILQFPGKMAQVGIQEAVEAAHGKTLPKRVDTGEPLATAHPMKGVPSITPAKALTECWG
ncbi:MAG TPA: substrate-binding domain-containing protein [Acidiphilium sp.]